MLISPVAQTAFNAITEAQHQAIAAICDKEMDLLRQRIAQQAAAVIDSHIPQADMEELVGYLMPDYVL
jgi:hypothetical protein